jgi:hypothetical protein
MTTTEYQTPTSAEARLDRARRFWRALFIGSIIYIALYTALVVVMVKGWWWPPDWVMRHF